MEHCDELTKRVLTSSSAPSHVKFARYARSSRGVKPRGGHATFRGKPLKHLLSKTLGIEEFYVSPVGRGREAPLRPLRGHHIMFYVYLLENQDDKSWYIGFSSDLKQRIKEHQEGKGGRTTSLKKRWKLIYYEAYLMKDDAIGREKFLKSGSGRTYLKKQLRNYLKF